MKNIIKYTNKKYCSYLEPNKYMAKINGAKVVSKDDLLAMVLELNIDGKEKGNLTISKWYHDSSKEESIKERKGLFDAIGHPEWFELDELDVTMLIGIDVIVDVGSYMSKKTNQETNCINGVYALSEEDKVKENKDQIKRSPFHDDDLPF